MRTVLQISQDLIRQIMAEREQYDHGSIGMIKGIQVLADAIEKELNGGEGSDDSSAGTEGSGREHAEPGEGSGSSAVQKTIDAPGC